VIHHTAIADSVQKDIVDKAHQRRFGTRSWYGSYILYHVLIGTDGTVIYNRGLNERTGHTGSAEINSASIAIALAGNFNEGMPPRAQISAMKKVIGELQSVYQGTEVIPHREASATQCPGTHLIEWIEKEYPSEKKPGKKFLLSRYYTPVRGQERYYRDSYEADFKVNCFGNCFSPADGGALLTDKDAYKVAACPKSYPFGTKLDIEGIGIVVCRDRGGAITDDGDTVRIDIWAGSGMKGLNKILTTAPPHNPRVIDITHPQD